MERKLLENDTYVLFKEDENPTYQYIVYIKANGFLQEVYRSWYRTKKMKTYFLKENRGNNDQVHN